MPTSVHDVAEDDDGRNLIALYVGDYDPSGLFMSEEDLPSLVAAAEVGFCPSAIGGKVSARTLSQPAKSWTAMRPFCIVSGVRTKSDAYENADDRSR